MAVSRRITGIRHIAEPIADNMSADRELGNVIKDCLRLDKGKICLGGDSPKVVDLGVLSYSGRGWTDDNVFFCFF